MTGKRRRGQKDFWRDWQDELAASEGSEREARPRRLSARRAHRWRHFFRDYMGRWPEEHWALSGRRFNPWRQGDDSYNPLVAGLLSKGGGLLPLYVLHLLAERPRYGNEIMEAISRRTGGGWSANPGAIYPLFALLEEQGLVAGRWEEPRKRTVRYYELTDLGRAELERLRAIFRPKLQESIAILQSLAGDLGQDEFI